MKKSILILAALLSGSVTYAQQIPQYFQYYANPFIYNPAFTGSEEDVNTYLIHRSLFQDIPGAPVTNALTIDGPIREKNVGLGLSLYTDNSDMVNRMGANTSYSYRLKLNDDMNLNLGAAIGVSETRIDFSKTIVRDVNDPFLMKNIQRKAAVDANFGVAYFWDDLQVGISVPQLLGNKVKFEGNDVRTIYQMKRHFLGSIKYSYFINEGKGISVYPLLLVRYAPGTPFSFDINAVADWKNKGWFAVSYKNDYAVGVNLGVRLNNTLSAGYAYDIITGPIKSYAGMSHEILLGFRFGGKKEEPLPPAETPGAADSQRISDLEGVANEQKAQILANKTEIDRLKQELEMLKARGADTTAGKIVNKSNFKGFVTSALTSDFVDSDGKQVMAGNYLVIGSFVKPENAVNANKAAVEKGYSGSKIIKNIKTNISYVYVRMATESAEVLIDDLNKVRKEMAADSWIYRLED